MSIFRKEVPPDFSELVELGSKLITALEENTRATHELLKGAFPRDFPKREPYRYSSRKGAPKPKGEEKAPHLRQAIEAVRPEGYLTISEAASEIGLSESGTRYRISRGKIPWVEVWAAPPVNKICFIKESDLPARAPRKFPAGASIGAPVGSPEEDSEESSISKRSVIGRVEEPAPPGFLTIAGVAEALGLTGEAVRQRIRKGELEAFKQPAATLGGYRYLVSQEALKTAPARYSNRGKKNKGSPKGETSLPEDMASFIKHVSEAEAGLEKLEAFRNRHQGKTVPDKVPN